MNKFPAIALLPGLLCTAELWRDQITHLKQLTGAEPLVADFSQCSSMPEMANVVLDMMPERFICLGLSMGGHVAFEVMRQAPERVLGLGLFDTSARADTPEKIKQRKIFMASAKTGTFKGINNRLLPTLIHETRLNDAGLTQRIKDMAIAIGLDGFLKQQTAIINRVDSRPNLSSIQVPSLIICGRQDALTPPELSEEMAAGIGHKAQLEIIENCGHLSTMEAPEHFNQLLEGWLTRTHFSA